LSVFVDLVAFADPPLPDFVNVGFLVGFFEGFGVEVELFVGR
jgi:hypothetical protein